MRQPCPEKEAFWRLVLSGHALSGLSVSEFCRREDVSQASFYQWRKKLAGSTATSAERANSGQRTSFDSSGVTSFIPVEVVARNDRNWLGEQLSAHSDITSVCLTIRTPQGYAVDVLDRTTIDVLQRSLRALQELASEPTS